MEAINLKRLKFINILETTRKKTCDQFWQIVILWIINLLKSKNRRIGILNVLPKSLLYHSIWLSLNTRNKIENENIYHHHTWE